MVMNSFMQGMSPQQRRPLTETNPTQQEPVEEKPAFRHKFSAFVTDEDFQLIRRVRFESDVNYSTLLHAMFDYCLREGHLDIDSLPKATGSRD